MTNYRFTFSYDGTRYHGWESKKNADTVEGRIEPICFFKFYAALSRFSISHILMKILKKCWISRQSLLILMALSATANGRSLISQTWHSLNISRNGNVMAINSFSGLAVRGKPCQKLSNGAGNRILNLMQLMTIFRKSSNSMDTTAGRFPVITISTTGCCFRKTQRHRTRNGAMPLCLFWHSFLVSAGYLPNTVFLIIKIC